MCGRVFVVWASPGAWSSWWARWPPGCWLFFPPELRFSGAIWDAPADRTRWRTCLAWTRKRAGQSDLAFEAAQQALELSRDVGHDQRGEAEALKTLGATHENLGDFDEAQECYEEALALARQAGDQRQEFNMLHYLGVQAMYNYADIEKALSVWETALCVAMDIECDNAEAHAWAELAIVYRNQIPRRPAKESPEEAEFERLTKIAVKHYVRGKELKEKWLEEKENESSLGSPSSWGGGGAVGSPDTAGSKANALLADKPLSPPRRKRLRPQRRSKKSTINSTGFDYELILLLRKNVLKGEHVFQHLRGLLMVN